MASMSDDVKSWLVKHSLGKYAEVFAKNEIDFRALPRLSEEDLIAMDLPLGTRRNQKAAIQQLPEEDVRPLTGHQGS